MALTALMPLMLLASASNRVLAQSTEEAEPPPEWLTGVGVGPMVILADACQRNDDVVGCSAAVPFLGFDLSVDRHLIEGLQLGVHLRLGVEPGSGRGSATSSSASGLIVRTSDEHRQLWAFGLQARFQEVLGDGLWWALSIEAAAIADMEEHFDANGLPSGERTTRQWGIAPGAALGYDFALTELLSLGVTLRAAWVSLAAADTERIHYEYAAGPALWLGPELRVGL